ncbi:IclR family transcriptional regulator [Nocardia higoensis]|uniref:IclR family transcriptional regulator n=1 Tax=Nocardia higoensis TaxID=228599 RepID=UPI0002D50E37|nr:IclR family transcriptional regulator C-terminal domain-containing protein [Nocardia higoensis]
MLRNDALPYLSALFARSELSVCLGVLHGSEIKLEIKIQSHHGFKTPTRAGERINATSTSLGKAILAFSPPSVVESYIACGLPRATRYSVVDPDAFRAELHEIRLRGFAADREESRLGIVSVAAPVIVNGAPQAAVSVSGRNRFDVGRLIQEVTQAARTIAEIRTAHTAPADMRSASA